MPEDCGCGCGGARKTWGGDVYSGTAPDEPADDSVHGGTVRVLRSEEAAFNNCVNAQPPIDANDAAALEKRKQDCASTVNAAAERRRAAEAQAAATQAAASAAYMAQLQQQAAMAAPAPAASSNVGTQVVEATVGMEAAGAAAGAALAFGPEIAVVILVVAAIGWVLLFVVMTALLRWEFGASWEWALFGGLALSIGITVGGVALLAYATGKSLKSLFGKKKKKAA